MTDMIGSTELLALMAADEGTRILQQNVSGYGANSLSVKVVFSDGSEIQLADDTHLRQFTSAHFVEEDAEREYDFYIAYKLTASGMEAGLDARESE